MHFMTFALKRAHLRAIAFVRPWLAHTAITPARYDILHLLHEHRLRPLRQTALKHALGISAATLSRMLKRLEELGFITRSPSPRDRRAKNVALTAGGRREFRHVLYAIRCPGHLHLAYEGALSRDPSHAAEMLDAAYGTIGEVARFFGDTSWLGYPTGHPDD